MKCTSTSWDWKEIYFFSVTFQHSKSMCGPLVFECMIALKLINRVGSKTVPEMFEEFAAERSVAIPASCQVIPLIPQTFEIGLAKKCLDHFLVLDQLLGYSLSKQLNSFIWSF